MFARWISEIQAYDFDVIHRPGKLHSNADTLSRYPKAGEDTEDRVMEVSIQDFGKMQQTDPYAGQWISFLGKNEKPQIPQKINTVPFKPETQKFLYCIF